MKQLNTKRLKYLSAQVCFICFLFLVPLSCGDGNNAYDKEMESQISFKIVNWNLQTFFDATKDGCEYKEFQKSSDWNSAAYEKRLKRLCQLITQRDTDIYIFEEIENDAVIYDICNQLTADGHNWKQENFWNYSAFTKENGSAIGIGILSRYPLTYVITHSMDIRLHQTKQPSVRPLMEVRVLINQTPLIILANHWKSKSGGEEETEIWRDWQESILANRLIQIKNENNGIMPAILICGDFNRDAQSFIQGTDKNNTVLRGAGFGAQQNISVNSLWYTQSGSLYQANGSYWYKNEWEYIDNIMLTGNISCSTFSPLAIEPWATAQGIPIPFKLFSSEGWSDHLPLEAQLILYSTSFITE